MRPVLSRVPGHVNTKANVACHALRRVTDSRAMSAALVYSLAVIKGQAFVERLAFPIIAKRVP